MKSFRIPLLLLLLAATASARNLRRWKVNENDRRLQNNPAFIEEDGLVVMNAESVPIVAPWKLEKNVRGFTGPGFIRFDGNDLFGGSPNGMLSYFFRIETAGQYRLVMRLRKDGDVNHIANDCYIRVPGQEGYLGQITKAYLAGRFPRNTWRWFTQLEVDHSDNFFPEPIYDFVPGTYELQVWGRSKNFFIDRMVLFKQNSVSFDFARDLARQESRRVGDSPTPSLPSPTSQPSMPPTSSPSLAPVTPAPSSAPVTPAPSSAPVSPAPTSAPVTSAPTSAPVTAAPTSAPVTSAPQTGAPVTSAPTSSPVTAAPTSAPVTSAPTSAPASPAPTSAPVTSEPTSAPVTAAPTSAPVTAAPTSAPVTLAPSSAPVTMAPSSAPVTPALTTASESPAPTTDAVSPAPTSAPTTAPSASPTLSPVTTEPTQQPSLSPTTLAPSNVPNTAPVTTAPSRSSESPSPSATPTMSPVTSVPTGSPTTTAPTESPMAASATAMPSISHVSPRPSVSPTFAPTTIEPTTSPTTAATTLAPTAAAMTSATTAEPTSKLTAEPTAELTTEPTAEPTTITSTGSSQTSAPTAFDWDSSEWKALFNASECFSVHNTVQLRNGEKKAISNVNIGDYILSSSGYSRVYSLGHHDTDAVTDFLQFFFNGTREALEITHGHLLFVEGALVRADSVAAGQVVGGSEVTAIQTVKRRGVFAPVTEQGDIYVSEVLASCFAAPLPEYSESFQHYAAQVLLSPRRLVCMFDFSTCEGEKLIDGRPDFVWNIAKAVFSARDCSTFSKTLLGCCVGSILMGATVLIWFLSGGIITGMTMSFSLGTLSFLGRRSSGRKLKQL